MSSDTSQQQDAPQAPVLKRKGFQFSDGVFSINGISCVDGPRLHELFNPETVESEFEQHDVTVEAQRLFKKPFFAAQLKYYGIPFQSSLPVAGLSALLKEAVHLGKCNRVPKDVQELEATMRAEYAPLQRKWEADYAAWSTEKKRREDDAFENCTTPGERAACDLKRFMDMYFLTNGKPDKSKTTTFLTLGDYSDYDALRGMARRIPGLEALTGPGELWVGWEGADFPADWEDMSDCADEDDEDDADEYRIFKAGHISALEREEFEREEYWDDLVEAYDRATTRSSEKDSTNKKQRESSTSDPRLGSYLIRCHRIEESWSDFPDGPTFTMDVWKGKGNILRVAYYFGVIEGTMILSESYEALSAMVDDVETDSETSESEEDTPWKEYADDEAEKAEDLSIQTSSRDKKRKASVSPPAKATSADTNAKRRKVRVRASPSTGSQTRNHSFFIRGRDTGTYEILPDPESGHLDFFGHDCATLEGVIYKHTLVGNDVRFEGRKVSDTPQKKPEAWEELGYKAHRREEVARW
ncbi:hypothetical protein TgHK011_002620 [Trichoderma gracile]|nr:hypothetical protein TgHK011_002620 [Trichoderma gracile]